MKICRWQNGIELVTRRSGNRIYFEGEWRCPRSGLTGQDKGGALRLECPYVYTCPEYATSPSAWRRMCAWLKKTAGRRRDRRP